MSKGYGTPEMSSQGLEKRADFIFVSEVDNLGSLRVFLLELFPFATLLQVHAVKLHQGNCEIIQCFILQVTSIVMIFGVGSFSFLQVSRIQERFSEKQDR